MTFGKGAGERQERGQTKEHKEKIEYQGPGRVPIIVLTDCLKTFWNILDYYESETAFSFPRSKRIHYHSHL